MTPLEAVGLLALGFVAGCYGTIIGAGGGFLVVPALAWLPFSAGLSAEAITGISLVGVLANAVSAVLAYRRQHRIDLLVALILGVVAVPGNILGRTAVTWFNRQTFQALFGAVLIVISLYLVMRKPPRPRPLSEKVLPFGVMRRTYRLASGASEEVAVDLRAGALVSFGIGFLASLLGVGGGLMMTPAMVALMAVPPPVATATAQLYVLTSAVAALLTDLLNGGDTPLNHLDLALPIAVGMVLGAQAGAQLSRRLSDQGVIRLLALALGLVGIRLLWAGLPG